MSDLPWICPDHPEGLIRHTWDQNHYVMNGYPVGEGYKSNNRFQCVLCGRPLAAASEPARAAQDQRKEKQ